MAGQPTIAANAPIASPASELAMVMQGYSPQTAVAAQHSQYLAQALQAMQQQGQNIRTPVALGSDLLAEALLQRKYGKSMQDFATAAAGDRGRFSNDLLGGLQPDDGTSAPAAAAPAAPATAAPAQSADPTPPPAPTPQNTAPLPRGLRDNNPLNITSLPGNQTWNGQTGADGPYAVFGDQGAGWQAADKNLTAYVTHHGLNTVSGIVSRWAPGGAGGNNPAAYAATVAQKLGVDPNQPLDLSTPEQRAPLLRAMAGVELGQPYGGPPAPAGMTPGRGQTPGGQPTYAPQGQPGPVQIATNPQSTPTQPPSPSPGAVQSSPGGTASAPPAAASPAVGGASAPPAYHQPVTAQEIALAKQWMSDPRTYQKGVELAMELRQRQVTQVKPEVAISREGQMSAYNPYDPTHTVTATNIPGWRNTLPAGWTWDASGKAVPTDAVKSGGTQQIPNSDTIAQVGPGGKLEPVAKVAYGDDQIRSDLDAIRKSPEYNNYNNSIAMYNTAISGAQRPGGLSDAMLKEYSARILSGGVAREFSSNMIDNAQGPVARLSMFKDQILGGQTLTPQARYAILQAMHDQVVQNQSNLQGLIASSNAFAKGKGVDLGPYTSPLMREAPSLPDVSAIPGGVGYRAPDVNLPGYRGPNLPTLTPEQAAHAPRGTQFRTSDGRVMVKS